MTSVSKHSRGAHRAQRSINGVRGERSASLATKRSIQGAIQSVDLHTNKIERKLATTAKKASLLFAPQTRSMSLDEVSLNEQIEAAINARSGYKSSERSVLKTLIAIITYTPKSFSLGR